jgi:hypothetical protein
MTSAMDTLHKDLDGRLDAVGWGLFLLMTGSVLLVPGLPDGSWLAGLGTILLGLGAVRAKLGMPVSMFGVIIAAGLVASGAGTMAGLAVPWFAPLLILCGLALVANALVRRPRQA